MNKSKWSGRVARDFMGEAVRRHIARLSVDRGDVPGWVLVTVMTAGLVVGLWTVADGQLKSVLNHALHSVATP